VIRASPIVSLAFWPLFALLIPQALWVKRSAKRFSPPPGARSGTTGSGPVRRLVGLGDSVIDGVGCSSLATGLIGRTAEALSVRSDCSVEWSASARTGARTRSIRRSLLPGAAIEQADFVVVSTGVNDVTGLTPLDEFGSQLEQLLADIRKRSPAAVIAVNGIPPMHRFPGLPQPLRLTLGLRARQLDAVVAQVADHSEKVCRVAIEFGTADRAVAARFAPDGYHPSEASCCELAQAVAESMIDAPEH
jgi:lysophospholipase L1-like esterase